MSEDKKAELVKLILSDNSDSKKLQAELADKPYSQPLQRLAAKDGIPNKDSLLRYSWLENRESNLSPSKRASISISTVILKDKKRPSKDKKEKAKKAPTQVTPKQQHLSNNDHVPVSDFSAWLSKSSTSSGTESSSATMPLVKKEEMLPKKLTAEPARNSKKKKAKSKKTKKARDNNPKSKKKGKSEEKGKEETGSSKGKKSSQKKKSKKKGKSKKDKELKKKIAASVARKEEIASETLAKLYEQQGHYDKAIEMYEHLSLKYPEKSSFFALFIADIKLKLK